MEKVKKQILSEIFDLIAEEEGLSSEKVGSVISRWVDYFNFWFDRRCLHCGKILDADTIRSEISPRAIISIFL